jgi:small-conductance mechanosensitive channel
VIWAVGLLIISSQIVPLQPLGETLLTTSGVLAVSFSITAQTALGNYIAGFFIVIHQPFEPGDAVYVKEMRMAGIVREINFRHTTLETANGNMIRVPNTVMNSVTIEDLTDNGYTRYIEFKVANSCDFDRLRTIINEIVSGEELSAKNNPLITIDSFDSQGCTVRVSLTAGTMNDFYNLRSNVIQKLSRALPENGITLV